MNLVRIVAFCLSLSVVGVAQDPLPPPGGFSIVEDLDRLVTFSDGYRTRLDVRYPVGTPPAGGWPVAMYVHGNGTDRKVGWVKGGCEELAGSGYVTLAYDTGNNGVTLHLNPPGTRSDWRRMTDLAEMFDYCETLLGPTMDQSRIGMMGKSAGAKHVLWAVGYGGQALPIVGSVATMPQVHAAHIDIQVIDAIADSLLQGTMIKAQWATAIYRSEGANGPVSTMMQQGDYVGLANWFLSEPAGTLGALVEQAQVPLMVSNSLDDVAHFANVNADSMAAMPPGVPRRFLQLTGTHGSVANNTESLVRKDNTRRWFDRYLKNVPNGIDLEPEADIGLAPSDPANYLDPQYPWQHRTVDGWPAAPSQWLYLRGNGQLMAQAPTTVEPGPTMQHRVAPGYGMLQFMQHDANPTAVLPHVPLVRANFDTGPLPDAREIVGRGVVEFDVTSTGPDFQMGAVLFDVDPSGNEHFITGGFTARRGIAPGRTSLRIELGDVGYVVPSGHRIRLSLENLNLFRRPGHTRFYVAPDFIDVDLTLAIDTTFAPRLGLPIEGAKVSLTPRIARVMGTNGYAHTLQTDGFPHRAGLAYLTALGITGSAPGTTVLGAPVPVNVDALTGTGVSLANTPFLPGFAGVLDAQGRAIGQLVVPSVIAPVTLGFRWTFATVVVEANGAASSSPAAELLVDP